MNYKQMILIVCVQFGALAASENRPEEVKAKIKHTSSNGTCWIFYKADQSYETVPVSQCPCCTAERSKKVLEGQSGQPKAA